MNIDKDIEIVKEIIKCDGCRFATCEQCEINWTQVNAISNVLSELEKKDKIIDLMLGEFIDARYDFKFIEPNKREDKRKEIINEYKEYYRKKVQK